jgi:hypothetical protein
MMSPTTRSGKLQYKYEAQTEPKSWPTEIIWKHTIPSAFSRICELVGAIISDKLGDNH